MGRTYPPWNFECYGLVGFTIRGSSRQICLCFMLMKGLLTRVACVHCTQANEIRTPICVVGFYIYRQLLTFNKLVFMPQKSFLHQICRPKFSQMGRKIMNSIPFRQRVWERFQQRLWETFRQALWELLPELLYVQVSFLKINIHET